MAVKLGTTLALTFNTRNPITLANQDADSPPTQEVYENNDTTPLTLSGASITDAGTGIYIAEIVCDGTSGFSAGNNYNWVVSATVGGVTQSKTLATFSISATTLEEDVAAIATTLGTPTDTDISTDLANIAASIPAAGLDAAGVRAAIGMASANLDTQLSAIGSTAGSGAVSTTINVTDGVNPIDGVEVWLTTDSSGTNVVAGTIITDTFGNAVFMLDAGTYYVWKQRSGYNFTNPVEIVVS